MHYRPEIDGLRAVAVLPVILFHAGLGIFSGGFVGVDVFFVISGYLITSILLREMTTGRFSMWRFWERRARRILPALYLVMAVCVPVAWVVMLPDQYLEFARSLVAVGVFASNILFWRESGYFAAAAEQKPLLHTWSLAVEEQFYILFPLFLLLLWRFVPRGVGWILACVALISLGLSEYAARVSPNANFYLLPTRAWELMLGALCALATVRGGLVRFRGWATDVGAGIGLALILGAVFWFDNTTPFPSAWALVPVLGTVLVILCANPDGLAGRVLSSRIMVGVGLISYSAYLWHQPLLAFTRIAYAGAPPLWVMLVMAGASLPLAVLSWRFVEQPFRRKDGPVSTLPRLGGALLLPLAAFLAIGIHGHMTEGRRTLWLASAPPEQAQMYRLYEKARDAGAALRPDPDRPCVMQITRLRNREARLQNCFERHGPGLLLVGDSHARMVMPVLQQLTDRPFVVTLAQGGCQTFSSRPECTYADELLSFVQERPDMFSHIVYHIAAQSLFDDGTAHAGSPEMFERHGVDAPLSGFVPDAARIDNVVSYLTDLKVAAGPDGPDIAWLGSGIGHYLPMSRLIREGCSARHALRPGQVELFAELDRLSAQNARQAQVTYVSRQRMVGFDAARDLMSCDALYWIDGHHWSGYGMTYFASRLRPLAERLEHP